MNYLQCWELHASEMMLTSVRMIYLTFSYCHNMSIVDICIPEDTGKSQLILLELSMRNYTNFPIHGCEKNMRYLRGAMLWHNPDCNLKHNYEFN